MFFYFETFDQRAAPLFLFFHSTQCQLSKEWAQFHRAALRSIKSTQHNKIMLTRIMLPAKLPCHKSNLWLVTCWFLLSRKKRWPIFSALKAAELRYMKLGPWGKKYSGPILSLWESILVLCYWTQGARKDGCSKRDKYKPSPDSKDRLLRALVTRRTNSSCEHRQNNP